MTKSEKIRKLSRCRALKVDYDLVLQAYLEHKSKMLSIQAQIITDMPTARSCNKDKVLSMYIRLDTLEERLGTIKRDRAEAKDVIVRLISRLEGKSKDVLTHRYVLCRTWRQICENMRLSWAHVHRLHNRGLEAMEFEVD